MEINENEVNKEFLDVLYMKEELGEYEQMEDLHLGYYADKYLEEGFKEGYTLQRLIEYLIWLYHRGRIPSYKKEVK